MSAKVIWYRDVVGAHALPRQEARPADRTRQGRQEDRREDRGADQREALALGEFAAEDKAEPAPQPILFGTRAREWHRLYAVTFKPRFHKTSLAILDNHLVPYFGERDLRDISEADLLEYIRRKLDAGQKPATILTALSVLRRVLNLAARDGVIARNPANGVGQLIARAARREDPEVAIVDAWTRDEAEALRRAQTLGVRPLKLHAGGHTFATLALEAGRSIRLVAEQLGHANPALTLRVYAHAVPVEGGDLSFADFGATGDVSGRLYSSPPLEADPEHGSAPGARARGRYEFLEHETGFEPATLTLAT